MFVDKLNQVREKDDEVMFFFPIKFENSSISKFKILLNHQNKVLLEAMHQILAELSFKETALCNTEESSYGRLSLFESKFETTLAVVELMECKYVNDFNYATMKLVFEEFKAHMFFVSQKLNKGQEGLAHIETFNQTTNRFIKTD